MKNDLLVKSGVFIFILGLTLALPNIDSILLDFTQLNSDTITLMRIGLVTIGVGIFLWGEN